MILFVKIDNVRRSQYNFPSNAKYNIYLSIFQDLNQRSLLFSSEKIIVKINSCYFFNSSCDGMSGAVFFQSQQSSIYHEKICAISCNTQDHGHYTYSLASEHQNYDNFIVQSSFLLSGDQTNKHGVVIIKGGNQKLKYNNFSRSLCQSYGSFVIMAPTNVREVSYCIIDSSKSTGTLIDARNIEHVMNYSTIINNTSNQSVIVTAYSNSKLIINDCNIIDNRAQCLMINHFSENALSAYRLLIQDTNTTCINAQLFETVAEKYEFDFNVLHLICDSIPYYYVNVNICSVCKNLCVRGFLQYSLYLVVILL